MRSRTWMTLNAAVLLSLAACIGWKFQRQPAPRTIHETIRVEVPVTTATPRVLPAVSAQRAKPKPAGALAAKPAAQKPTAQKPTLQKKTVDVLKTAGKKIAFLVRKVKRESPVRR